MVIHSAVAVFTTARLLRRMCPACGHEQLAPPSRLGEEVACWKCGATVAPARDPAA